MVLRVRLGIVISLERPFNRQLLSGIATPTTFSNTSPHSNAVAVSTTSPEILELSSTTGQVIRTSPTISVVNHLQYTHLCLLAGCSDGTLRLMDDRNSARREGGESSVQAHHSSIEGMQYSGNFVYTIGWGVRLVIHKGAYSPLILSVQARSSVPRSPC